jgi:hypothetical protein
MSAASDEAKKKVQQRYEEGQKQGRKGKQGGACSSGGQSTRIGVFSPFVKIFFIQWQSGHTESWHRHGEPNEATDGQ